MLCLVFWAPSVSSNGTSLGQLKPTQKALAGADENVSTAKFKHVGLAVFLVTLPFSSVKYELQSDFSLPENSKKYQKFSGKYIHSTKQVWNQIHLSLFALSIISLNVRSEPGPKTLKCLKQNI